jgi:hypothetical protein
MSQNMMPEIRIVVTALFWNLPFIAIFFISTIWASVKTKTMDKDQVLQVSKVCEQSISIVSNPVPEDGVCSIDSFFSSHRDSRKNAIYFWITTGAGLSKQHRI